MKVYYHQVVFTDKAQVVYGCDNPFVTSIFKHIPHNKPDKPIKCIFAIVLEDDATPLVANYKVAKSYGAWLQKLPIHQRHFLLKYCRTHPIGVKHYAE